MLSLILAADSCRGARMSWSSPAPYTASQSLTAALSRPERGEPAAELPAELKDDDSDAANESKGQTRTHPHVHAATHPFQCVARKKQTTATAQVKSSRVK